MSREVENPNLTMNLQADKQNISATQDSYNNYIDTSQVIIEYYQNQPTTGLEGLFLQIQEWLDKPVDKKIGNVPLILVGDEGAGKKTTVVKWIEHHEKSAKQKYKDIILSHFATTGGNNKNYYFAIYRFLVKLREILNIKQQVQLLEEKLRKYFYYWLEVCNQELNQQISTVLDDSQIYENIILIIQGIDHFQDPNSEQKQTPVSFWLPKNFPERIKVIATTERGSTTLDYFEKLNSQIINLPRESRVFENMVQKHSSRELFVSEENQQQLIGLLIFKQQVGSETNDESKKMSTLFIKTYLGTLLPYPSPGIVESNQVPKKYFDEVLKQIDENQLEKIYDVKQLFHYILDLYQNKIMQKQKYIKVLLFVCLTQKGLYLEEIQFGSDIDLLEWKSFVAAFKMFLMKYQDLWFINNDIFKSVVLEKYGDQKTIEQTHNDIAGILGQNTPNSIRQLQEETYHLYNARTKNFQLKGVISAIENFLLLFNPNNQYDLCRYWQKLEECHFDPVIQYNKSIEGFVMQFHPTKEDTFRIIVQISRFLQEFSDFETYYTPQFRHPPIKGVVEDLDDIGLYMELMKLNMFNLDESVKQPQKEEATQKSSAASMDEKIQRDQISEKVLQIRKKLGMMTQEQKEDERKKKEAQKAEKEKQKNKQDEWGQEAPKEQAKSQLNEQTVKQFTILKDHETLNIDIPTNRSQFKEWYFEQLSLVYDEKKNQRIKEQDPLSVDRTKVPRSEAMYFKRDYDPADNKEDDEELAKHNNQPLLDQLLQIDQENNQYDKNFQTQKIGKLREHYYLNEHNPGNYYYQRWLWVQFPWSCLSINCDYSVKLHQCFSSETQYMSIEKEQFFTQQALKIAIDAQLQKMAIFHSDKNSRYDTNASNIQKNLSKDESTSSNNKITRLPKIVSRSSSQTLVELALNQDKPISTIREDTHMSFTDSQASSSSRNVNRVAIVDPIEMEKKRKIPSQVRSYAQSSANLKQTESDEGHINSGIFLTEDFLDQNQLNRELKANKSMQKITDYSIDQPIDAYNTSLILQRSHIVKDKSQKQFDPINSIKDPSNYSIVLPKLKSSILNHSMKELSILDGQNQDLSKQYNQLVYTNNVLAQQLRDLQIIQINLNSYSSDGVQTKEKAERVQNLQQKLSETETQFLRSLVQIERLNTIIKICDDNQTQNEEWIKELNKLLVSLKKVIKYELQDIDKIQKTTSDLNKANQLYLDALKEKMNNQDSLMREIQQNLRQKKDIDFYFSNTDDNIQGAAIRQHELLKSEQTDMDQNQINKQKQNQLKENTKKILEEVEKLRHQITEIKGCIDITQQEFEKKTEYQSFLLNLEQQRELKATILQRQQRLESLNRLYEKLKKEQKVYKEAENYRRNTKKFQIKSKKDLEDTQTEDNIPSTLNSPNNSILKENESEQNKNKPDQKVQARELQQQQKVNQQLLSTVQIVPTTTEQTTENPDEKGEIKNETTQEAAQTQGENQKNTDIKQSSQQIPEQTQEQDQTENKVEMIVRENEPVNATQEEKGEEVDLTQLDDKELHKYTAQLDIEIANETRNIERLKNYQVLFFNTYSTFQKQLNLPKISEDQKRMMENDDKMLKEKLTNLKQNIMDKLDLDKLEQYQSGQLEINDIYQQIVREVPRTISQNSSAVSSESNVSKSQYLFGQY